MTHCFFKVKTQFENLGDALINRELIKQLKPTEKLIICIKNVPTDFLKNLDIESAVLVNSSIYFYYLMLKSRLSLNNVNYFLNPGGYGGKISPKKVIMYLGTTFIFSLFKIIGIKVHRVGVSFSNLSTFHSYMLRLQSKVLYSNSVRDSLTFEICRKLKIRVSKIVPDLAFTLAYENSNLEKTYDIVISVRKPNNNIESLFIALDKIVKSAHGKILFIYQVKFDQDFQERLYSRYKSYDVELRDLSKLLTENERLFSQCKYVVSNRLHVLLLAMSKGAMPLALIDPAENSKIIGIFKDANIFKLIKDYTNCNNAYFSNADITTIQDIFINNHKLINDFFTDLNK
ncbi:polysaccharide pyruvyl transferase family protein [Paraglaciecola sp. 25GB23A]|uniref:polysaccharide pyruvyl transferase family protein n=1 Tax=Paraglaciecola sp. 25GB23A TaxID=3156068 RepID=UPI0032AE8AA3